MTSGPLLSLDSFKLPATFSTDGVVHTDPDSADEVWTDISVLGHGSQGRVYLQQLQSGPTRLLRAVKELSPDLRKSNTGDVMRELNMMMAVRDQDELFVRLFGWFDNPRGRVFLAMEYVPHGDLAQYIKTTPNAQRESREVTKQLLAGLSVLHSRLICHRDLKPQNVLLASLTPIKVKLADFGISKSTVGTDLRTRIGTVNYMAPEQLGLLPLNLRLRNEYTIAVDMWALGFVVHELLTGKTPFLETTAQLMSSGFDTEAAEVAIDMSLMFQFCDGLARFPLEALRAVNAASSAINFIRRLVVPDPRARATPDQALIDPSANIDFGYHVPPAAPLQLVGHQLIPQRNKNAPNQRPINDLFPSVYSPERRQPTHTSRAALPPQSTAGEVYTRGYGNARPPSPSGDRSPAPAPAVPPQITAGYPHLVPIMPNATLLEVQQSIVSHDSLFGCPDDRILGERPWDTTCPQTGESDETE